MAANMAEPFTLLRGPNRASLSSTPPPGQGPTVDPIPWVPPTQVPENIDAPAPPTLHTSVAHPFTSPFPPPPAPTAVPLPLATSCLRDRPYPHLHLSPYRPRPRSIPYLRRWFSRHQVHLLRLTLEPRNFLHTHLYNPTSASPTKHHPL
ncbi:hypothetical protein CRG98_008477 [Punica granatum]|uniref:Extensin-like n=1 Tax=Punica granatum TaxID=22663 RepID=A0A2I0KS70_PUNGR|nr:hypothetical protein CRG98_008477 [Punica granatum]